MGLGQIPGGTWTGYLVGLASPHGVIKQKEGLFCEVCEPIGYTPSGTILARAVPVETWTEGRNSEMIPDRGPPRFGGKTSKVPFAYLGLLRFD